MIISHLVHQKSQQERNDTKARTSPLGDTSKRKAMIERQLLLTQIRQHILGVYLRPVMATAMP